MLFELLFEGFLFLSEGIPILSEGLFNEIPIHFVKGIPILHLSCFFKGLFLRRVPILFQRLFKGFLSFFEGFFGVPTLLLRASSPPFSRSRGRVDG